MTTEDVRKQRAVVLTDGEWADVKARARLAGVSASAFIAALVDGSNAITTGDPITQQRMEELEAQVLELEADLVVSEMAVRPNNYEESVIEHQRLDALLDTMQVRLLKLEQRGEEVALTAERTPVRSLSTRGFTTKPDRTTPWTPGIGLSKWQQAHPGKRENGS